MASIEEFIVGEAGRSLMRSWRPAGPSRAVVVICHGFNSHSAGSDDVAAWMTPMPPKPGPLFVLPRSAFEAAP